MPISIGLQLYTLREEATRDLPGTLRKVSQMGYQLVELYDNYGLSSQALGQLLNSNGLKALFSHVGLDKLENNLQATIDYYLDLGCQYLVCPYLPAERRRNAGDLHSIGALFTKIGEICAEHGIQFCYHNHDFEFQDFTGSTGFDLLLDSSNPLFVQAELDLYWVKYAGLDPVALLGRLKNRCPLVHLKDIGPDRRITEFGAGLQDWEGIFKAARECGVKHYLIEQDYSDLPPLEAAAISLRNLQKMNLL